MTAPSRPGAPRSSSRTRGRSDARPGQRRSSGPAPGPTTGGIRTGSTRPGGPSGLGRTEPEHRPGITPAKPRGSFAAMLSWRTAVLVGVLILALAVVLPSLRAYFQQQEDLQELREEVQAARVEVDDLEAEVARWDDPAFVVAQARERLAYVFPGETPYRVIDPEFVATHAEGSPAAEQSSEARDQAIWYDAMWESIIVAGNGEEVEEEVVVTGDEEPAEEEPLTDIDFGG